MSLNPSQFPGMPRDRGLPVVQPHGPTAQQKAIRDEIAYGGEDGAHRGAVWGSQTPFEGSKAVENPIPRPSDEEQYSDATKDHNVVVGGVTRWQYRDEFIPSWRVTSAQPQINPGAVAHQVANADPQHLRERPEVIPYLGEESGHDAPVEKYDLGNGNHRVNAALERGQLFVHAEVGRTTGYLKDEAEGRIPR